MMGSGCWPCSVNMTLVPFWESKAGGTGDWQYTQSTLKMKVQRPMWWMWRRKNEVAAVGSTKCIVREISDGGRDRGCDATAYHDVRGRVDDGVAVVAAVEDRVVGAHGDSGELLACGKSVEG